MRKAFPLVGAALAVVVFAAAGLLVLAEDKKPKYTVKQVMKEAHAGGKKSLRTKVVTGKAEKTDKEKLLELYVALDQNKPPKGDAKHWKKLTAAIVIAAKDVVADKEGAIQKLTTATTCMTCHKDHKPPEDDD
jgi:hypothetical protein